MRQKQINKNVDYLYNLQKDETVHQNHRVTWILSAQALLFTGLCALAHNTLIDIIEPLIIAMGLLLAISAIYSMSISELSIGHVLKCGMIMIRVMIMKKNAPILIEFRYLLNS